MIIIIIKLLKIISIVIISVSKIHYTIKVKNKKQNNK